MNEKILSIIIPAWNEEKTLAKVIDKLIALNLPYNYKKEIIIINDSSTDKTPWIAKKFTLRYPKLISSLSNEKNLGKSRTVRKGILHSHGSYVIIQDADLELNPNEIAKILEIAVTNNLDFVYGNRFNRMNQFTGVHFFGNLFLNVFLNLFTYPRLRKYIPDMAVCYKLIKGDIARTIAKSLESKSSFGLEPEITIKLSKHKTSGCHLQFAIVPISYKARSKSEGKKLRFFRDGLTTAYEIAYFNLKRTRG